MTGDDTMLPKQGDWVTFRSNEADIGDLQPGDKGMVERVNTDKGIVDALLGEMKKVALVEKVARLLASSRGDHQASHLVWLLEVLDHETKDNDAFRKMLEDLRDHITARLEADYWQELPPGEERVASCPFLQNLKGGGTP